MNIAIKKALQLIEKGKLEEAIKELQETNQTADHETKYSIAEMYYQLGLVDLAKEIMEELLVLYPDEGELYTFMAELLIDLDEEDEAIEMLLEIKEEDAVYVQGQLLLADLYQLQGLEEVAEQKLLKAEEMIPDEPVVQFGLGEFYLARGDYLKSIPYYKRALPYQKELEGTNISLRLAEAFSGSGAFEEAMTYYKKSIKDQYATIDDHFGYGYTALQVGNYSMAIRQFEKVIDMDESFSSLYPYLGEAYEENGQIHEALQIIKKGLEIDEYNEALYIQGARISLNNGYVDEGEQYVRKVLAINPSHFEGVTILGNLLKKEERYEELKDLVFYLLNHGEEDPLFDWFLGTAHSKLDEWEQALPLYDKSYASLEHDSDFLEEYGQLLLECGQREKALVILKKAFELDQTNDQLQDMLLHLESE